MSSICIRGGYCLNGEVDIQGAKNAALPIMAASLLNKGLSVLDGALRYRMSDICAGCLNRWVFVLRPMETG